MALIQNPMLFHPMSATQPKPETRPLGLIDGIRDIQGQHLMLTDLIEKEKAYTVKLTEMVKTLQRDADDVIPLRPEAIGERCQAAYLVSEGVVVMFDAQRHMSSKPFSALPASAIVSAIEDCTSALSRLMADKRRTETDRVESLERVMKELKKAQTTFRVAKAEEPAPEDEEFEEAQSKPVAQAPMMAEESVKEEAADNQRAPRTGEGFSFKGIFGDKTKREGS
jgi:hypothetical protein